MSVIKSLDEWWEARENKRLECFDDGEWREDRTLSSLRAEIGGVARLLKEGRYRWKPEEITLVEWRHAQSKYLIYFPEGAIPPVRPYIETGRTVTGVIKGADLKAFVMHNMPELTYPTYDGDWHTDLSGAEKARIDKTIEACKYAMERLEEQE